jgi:hypothetical protein
MNATKVGPGRLVPPLPLINVAKVCRRLTSSKSSPKIFLTLLQAKSLLLSAKKIYRLKEDQAFTLSLELGRREKFARHPSADILLHSIGGGGDFVDTVIAF